MGGPSCRACGGGACGHPGEGPSACIGVVRGSSGLCDVGVCSCRLVVEPLRGLAVEGVVVAVGSGVVAVGSVEAVRTGWEIQGVEFGVDSGGRPAGVVTKLVRDRRLS